MPYTPPTSEELHKTIEELLVKYPGSNEEHKAFIKIVQAIHQSKTATEEARRAAMYITLLQLSNNNHLVSSKKKTLFGYKCYGSELDDLLRKGLKMGSSNMMEDQDYILMLSELFGELERHPKYYEHLLQRLQPKTKNWFYEQELWKDLASLKEHILKTVKPYISKHSETIAKELNNAMTSEQLKREFDEVIRQYRGLKKDNSYHDQFVNFMEFINTMCEVYAEPNKDKMGLDPETEKLFSNPYQLRLAVYCFVFEAVEQERFTYRVGLTKPEGNSWLNDGSDLYKILRQVFNCERIANMNPDNRETCLKEIHNFVDKQKFVALEKLAKDKVDPKVIASVKANLNRFNKKILEQINKVSALPRQASTVGGTAGKYVSDLTTFGLDVGISEVAPLLVPDIGRKAVQGAGGAIGYLVFGPFGGFLGAVAADKLVSTLASEAACGGFICKTKGATEKVGNFVGGIVTIAIYPLEKGFKYVFSKDPAVRAAQEKCLAQNENLMKSLQYLPPKAFPSYMNLARENKAANSNLLTPESPELLERRAP